MATPQVTGCEEVIVRLEEGDGGLVLRLPSTVAESLPWRVGEEYRCQVSKGWFFLSSSPTVEQEKEEDLPEMEKANLSIDGVIRQAVHHSKRRYAQIFRR